VPRIRDQFMPKSRIELLKLVCGINRNNALVCGNQEYWHANVAHQLAIVRIRRRENLERADLSGQPRIGHVLEKLGGPARMPEPQVSQQRVLR